MKTALIAALFAATFGTAAAAQMAASSPMAADAMATVPAAAQTKIVKCMAMKHDAMMKNATCMKMMKLYPAAFAGSASSN